MKIVSKTGVAKYPANNIYQFISDFRNFNNFIPADTVSGWEADTDTCSFSVSMLGKMGLRIIEKQDGKLVKISSIPEISQYNFTLWIQFAEVNAAESKIRITIEPQLNQVMLTMAKKPLKSFIDSLVDEIQNFHFPDQ